MSKHFYFNWLDNCLVTWTRWLIRKNLWRIKYYATRRWLLFFILLIFSKCCLRKLTCRSISSSQRSTWETKGSGTRLRRGSMTSSRSGGGRSPSGRRKKGVGDSGCSLVIVLSMFICREMSVSGMETWKQVTSDFVAQWRRKAWFQLKRSQIAFLVLSRICLIFHTYGQLHYRWLIAGRCHKWSSKERKFTFTSVMLATSLKIQRDKMNSTYHNQLGRNKKSRSFWNL